MIFEGQEKADFWTALGGKEEYASDKRLQEDESDHPIRLFQCSNASGNFIVEEIPDFAQVRSQGCYLPMLAKGLIIYCRCYMNEWL